MDKRSGVTRKAMLAGCLLGAAAAAAAHAAAVDRRVFAGAVASLEGLAGMGTAGCSPGTLYRCGRYGHGPVYDGAKVQSGAGRPRRGLWSLRQGVRRHLGAANEAGIRRWARSRLVEAAGVESQWAVRRADRLDQESSGVWLVRSGLSIESVRRFKASR